MVSANPPPHVYLNLANFHEYQNFEYKFDFATVLFAISFFFFIPSFVCSMKMLIFRVKTPKITVSSHGIHPYIFNSFLSMQTWNILFNIVDYLIVRIPATSFFTATCVSLSPDTFYRYIYAAGYFTFITSQLSTVLFCITRVLILYTLFNQDELCRKLYIGWAIFTHLFALIDAIPNIFGTIICMQLDAPFEEGAIALASTFVYGNNFMNLVHFIFSTCIVIVIAVSTVLVVLKLRSENMRKTSNSSKCKTKAETTLTVTTILIMIPLILAQAMTISSLLSLPYFSYILAIRPLMLDLRVNVVSIYFYFTHPVFKKKNSVTSTKIGSTTI
ncbi:unnamed protein product [Caenorhabditis brenneri]